MGTEYQAEEVGLDLESKKAIYLSIKAPLKDELGNIEGLIGISIDITDRKQAEIAKQEFLMNMAHDLRTPLAGIIGLSSIQADSKMEPQEQQEYGQMIQGASEQLLELLNSVIEVTATEHQVEQLKKEPINLSQLSDELQTLMQPSLQSKGLQFRVKCDNNLPSIISDRIKLKRLLLNILSNAVKFTSQGEIGLEINLLAIENDQAKIEIQISDTGIGIAKDKLDKIFDRFYRAYPSYQGEYKGYGIGLYLVKKTVELLNGEIKVSSKEDIGSCFTLYFNFSVADQDPNKNKTALQEFKPVAHSELGKRKGMVLVAEDNELGLHAVKSILVKLGYEVTAATEGNAALHALQTQSFVWALLDIGLPDLSGTEVAQAYRQWEQANNKPHLPLFALTAHAEGTVSEKCKEAGIDYILKKPFTEKDVQVLEKRKYI
jgi:signal transduction histidine kinase/CheY-like chemotaxis protein